MLLGQVGFLDTFTVTLSRMAGTLAIEDPEVAPDGWVALGVAALATVIPGVGAGPRRRFGPHVHPGDKVPRTSIFVVGAEGLEPPTPSL